MSGGPLDISEIKHNPNVSAIIWCGYPGQSGGKAIAKIIKGERNPAARLPVTWYPADFANVSMRNVSLRPDVANNYPGRTYRFYNREPVYEFGYGLSYTSFTY